MCIYYRERSLLPHLQEKVLKVTVLTRRKVEKVAEEYGVDVAEEEQQGRLVQHVEGS